MGAGAALAQWPERKMLAFAASNDYKGPSNRSRAMRRGLL